MIALAIGSLLGPYQFKYSDIGKYVHITGDSGWTTGFYKVLGLYAQGVFGCLQCTCGWGQNRGTLCNRPRPPWMDIRELDQHASALRQ